MQRDDEAAVTETSLHIELCRDSGDIRVYRATELGTYSRTIER
ncbi:hypothetical protein [Haloferax sp. DFSO60]